MMRQWLIETSVYFVLVTAWIAGSVALASWLEETTATMLILTLGAIYWGRMAQRICRKRRISHGLVK